ncbi:MAG: hypothetical protein ACLP01_03625 [Solirubrobacteraceae bacterium]
MSRELRPGPASMKGLEWLARVGPSPLDPWRYSMGWSEVAARNHARRLEREGWLERCSMVRGHGSLFLATRKGICVLGLPLIAATTPAPTTWAHDSACAWTAAWLTLRGRTYLGPREILDNPKWAGKLDWLDCHSLKRSGHRPDLVGFLSDTAIAIEVELAPKSKPTLNAILQLHLGWIVAGKTHAVIYMCRDEEGCRRIERTGKRVGLYSATGHLRIELLDTIKPETVAAFETTRTPVERTAA